MAHYKSYDLNMPTLLIYLLFFDLRSLFSIFIYCWMQEHPGFEKQIENQRKIIFPQHPGCFSIRLHRERGTGGFGGELIIV